MSVLIWASAAGWLTSLVLVCGQGILALPEAMETWMEGMKVGTSPHVGPRFNASSGADVEFFIHGVLN